MYLFQRPSYQLRFLRLLLIYIPLCIYFNYACLAFPHLAYSIYIPLCIYFNNIILSLLFISFRIYIPLCIYFNKIKIYKSAFWIYIYIPLCIYFNKYGLIAQPCTLSFTFHYVSISTYPFLS